MNQGHCGMSGGHHQQGWGHQQHHHHQGMQGHQGMPGGQQQGFQPVFCPPQYRFNDCFTKQEMPFIHPIVNVNRHHVVGVPQHYYTETTEDVMGSTIMPGRGPGMGPGFGPGSGGMWGGQGCHRRRRCR
ncbi:hypothetical protein [Sporosarcina sp. P20a]|uniref:hypothetical protein n=1 Tax=Sporosarcina sp. P20a TaxID=2048256 RepID=UPI00117B5625|nr:hypothetical protein [Sporosarcina sp. P20a]